MKQRRDSQAQAWGGIPGQEEEQGPAQDTEKEQQVG